MSVFDPNDWWERNSWYQTKANERRRPEEVNREAAARWLASVALCLCFAALAPPGHLTVAFGGLLLIAAVGSACLAALRQEQFHAPHLTAWDEATWSCAAGVALLLWAGTGSA